MTSTTTQTRIRPSVRFATAEDASQIAALYTGLSARDLVKGSVLETKKAREGKGTKFDMLVGLAVDNIPYWEETLAESSHADSNTRFYVAEVDRKVVGYSRVTFYPNDGRKRVEINFSRVDQAHLRSGVATALASRTIEDAKAAGYELVIATSATRKGYQTARSGGFRYIEDDSGPDVKFDERSDKFKPYGEMGLAL